MPKTTSEEISVIIVSYNSNDTIYKLLTSLKLIDTCISEIIIIDNNSVFFYKDKIKNLSVKIKIIENKKNIGFAKAVNQGIRICKSNYVLLLNPDTYLIDRSIINSFRIIKKDSRVGAIGGKILNEKLKNNFTANSKPSFLTGLFEFTNLKKIYPKNKYTSNFWIEKNKKINKPIDVSSLCGAYLLFRKKINNKLNLFNEKYFLYLEDVDFGIKINNQGYRVVFDPDSQIVHIGGYSTNNKYKTNLNEWYKSREIFFKKHLNFFAGIILISIFKIEKNILKFRSLIQHESIN
jgi:hypothetical protein